MNIKKLFSIADRAKAAGELTLANVIFATVLRGIHLKAMNPEQVNISLDFRLELETEDEIGTNFEQAFYDLAVIVVVENGMDIGSITMPIPLLSVVAAVSFTKLAMRTHRRPHHREVDKCTPTTQKELWNDFDVVTDVSLVRKALFMLSPVFEFSKLPTQLTEGQLEKLSGRCADSAK